MSRFSDEYDEPDYNNAGELWWANIKRALGQFVLHAAGRSVPLGRTPGGCLPSTRMTLTAGQRHGRWRVRTDGSHHNIALRRAISRTTTVSDAAAADG